MDELMNLHADGIFLRRDALAHGYDDTDLREALLDGLLARIRHGAYVGAEIFKAASEVEKHRLRSHAVLRSHDSRLALTHTSAAVEHGLWLHRADLTRVHVLCLDKPMGKFTSDVVYHRMPRRPLEIVESSAGQLCTAPLEAGIGTAALHNVSTGLVVLDSVVHLDHADVDDVRRAVERIHGPGTRKLHITARLVRHGIESVGEALNHYLCWSQHLPEPALQFEVRDDDGTLIARVDFAWPEFGLLGEFDGREKYHRFRRPGESLEQMIVREKDREDRIRELTGWLLIRLIWEDLGRPAVTAARIREQLARGARLLG